MSSACISIEELQYEGIFFEFDGYTIGLIGDIFNLNELVTIAQTIDPSSITHNKAGIFLVLYRALGKKALPLIDGYFSIIFIQANQVEFYTNSNPTYPLYYYSQNDDLWISNEVKHLTRIKSINSDLRPLIDFNPRSFYDVTIFKYIERIALKSHLTCFMNDDQSINIACSLYKKTDLIINYSNRNKILSCLDYLFESITKSLVNYSCKNNNIGVALSGGVGSSLIAGYIRQCYPTNANIHCLQ